MVEENRYDVVVLGTGAAGSTVAYKCRDAGLSVAIIDNRPFGGTCALRGCDPKKVLVGAAEVLHRIEALAGKGLDTRRVSVNWPELMQFKRSFTDPVPESNERSFSKAGMDTFHGTARFTGPSTLQIGDQSLTGRFIVLATGAEPTPLGFGEQCHVITSEQFLELDELPPRVAMIGGGYISFEFAFIAASAGSTVQIFHKNDRPLAGFDHDLVAMLLKSAKQKGIEVHLNAPVTEVRSESDELQIVQGAGTEQTVTPVDMVVHGAGRTPDFSELDPVTGNVMTVANGVAVNEYLQSVSNPAVYAAGDAAASPGPPLTPVGTLEGHIIASNIVKGNNRTPDYRAIPTVAFTLPHLARVGMLEHEAEEAGLEFSVKHEDTTSWYTSRRIGEVVSGYKTLVEKGTDRLLGAHLLGPNAEEVINLFAVAMRNDMKASDLRRMIFAYPTASSDVSYMV